MIPLATTRITVTGVRPVTNRDPNADGYDEPGPAPAVLASDVRACISRPNGVRKQSNVDETETYSLRCDNMPDGLMRTDKVTDQTDGQIYIVTSVQDSVTTMFDLQHTVATLRQEKGINSGGDDANVPTR